MCSVTPTRATCNAFLHPPQPKLALPLEAAYRCHSSSGMGSCPHLSCLMAAKRWRAYHARSPLHGRGPSSHMFAPSCAICACMQSVTVSEQILTYCRQESGMQGVDIASCLAINSQCNVLYSAPAAMLNAHAIQWAFESCIAMSALCAPCTTLLLCCSGWPCARVCTVEAELEVSSWDKVTAWAFAPACCR